MLTCCDSYQINTAMYNGQVSSSIEFMNPDTPVYN